MERGILRRPPHCAAQGREGARPRAQVLVRTATPDAAISRGGSVGDVATAGPSGVLSVPRAALPHSGGVRKHRRYVFAPVVPRVAPRRPLVTPGGRGGSKVRVRGLHRVDNPVAGPVSPLAIRSCALRGKTRSRTPRVYPVRSVMRPVGVAYRTQCGGAVRGRPAHRRLQKSSETRPARGERAGSLGDQGLTDPRRSHGRESLPASTQFRGLPAPWELTTRNSSSSGPTPARGARR